MATIDDVRLGLAANLRALEDVNIYPYPQVNVTTPTLAVAGIDEVDYVQDMGAGADLRFLIEGATGSQSLDHAIKRFDKWIWPEGDDSVRAALEADQKLTSRLKPDRKTVLTDQDPAASAVQLVEFRGYAREALETGGEALTGIWVVQVLI